MVNLFKGVQETSPGGATGAVDKALDGVIRRLIEDGEITGKQGELTLLHTMGKIGPGHASWSPGWEHKKTSIPTLLAGCRPRPCATCGVVACARR